MDETLTTRSRALVVGPHPPQIGGITPLVVLLRNAFGDANVDFIDSGKASSSWKRIVRPVSLLSAILRHLRSGRYTRLLVFGGAQFSFWEKCVWAAVSKSYCVSPVIVMVAGDFPMFFEKLPRALQAVARRAMRGVEIGAQSEAWKRFFEREFPGASVSEVKAGIDADRFARSEERERQDETVRLLYVGWMTPNKGVYDLFAALASLRVARPDVRLRCVGPVFDQGPRLQAEVDRLGLGGVVQLVGAVTSHEGVRAEYHAADVFVLASHYEGLPVALLEAMSSGLPCIVTDVGAIAEMVQGGSAGVLVPPHDPASLAAAIVELVDDPERRRVLGRRAEHRIRTGYSLGSSVESYRHLLGLPAAAPDDATVPE